MSVSYAHFFYISDTDIIIYIYQLSHKLKGETKPVTHPYTLTQSIFNDILHYSSQFFLGGRNGEILTKCHGHLPHDQNMRKNINDELLYCDPKIGGLELGMTTMRGLAFY